MTGGARVARTIALAVAGAFLGMVVCSGIVWGVILLPEIVGSGVSTDDLDRVRDSTADTVADVVGAVVGAVSLPTVIARWRGGQRPE